MIDMEKERAIIGADDKKRAEDSAVEIPRKPQTEDEYEKFFDEEANFLAAHGMRGDIVVRRGSGGWSFNYETRVLNYDPNYFRERGYNLKETLYATSHELLAHYRRLSENPTLCIREWRRVAAIGTTENGVQYLRTPHLKLLLNIMEDIAGNRQIVAGMPFLQETQIKLYREHQFPKTDYTNRARHVQFVYGLLRKMMVPSEEVAVAPEVREAWERLRSYGEPKTDVLDLATTPSVSAETFYAILRTIIEPIYQELYEKDLREEAERQEKEAPGGEQGGDEREKGVKPKRGTNGETEPGKRPSREAIEKAKKKLEEQYHDYEESHPEPLSSEEAKKIREAMAEVVAKRGGAPDMDDAILKQWTREHGLRPESVAGYRNEYKEIAPYVDELREVFKKIISRRLKERWKYAPQLKQEGEELDEGALAESYVASRAGESPGAFRDLERKTRETESFGSFDMTLINDLSSSMNEGIKMAMDRKSKMLFMEALSDFASEIKEAEQESGAELGLSVRSRVRAFGGFGEVELKPLSPELVEQERIHVWEKLHQGTGGTPDYLSLEAELTALTPEEKEALQGRKKRKVVIVLTDGESERAERVEHVLKTMRELGIIAVGIGMAEEAQLVLETYRPDAEVVKTVAVLPAVRSKYIVKYAEDL